MAQQLLALALEGLVIGLIGVIGGGFIFESGKRYVKVAGSNQFTGKIEAVPFFVGVMLFGLFIKNADEIIGNPIHSIVNSLSPTAQLGAIIIVGMAGFNYSVPNFNYFDRKSVLVYAFGLALILILGGI